MTLNEEVELIHFTLKMAEVLQKNIHDVHDTFIDLKNGASLSIINDEGNMYVKWKPDHSADRHTVFAFDASDYTNVRGNDCWTVNFYKDGDFANYYSVVNSVKDELKIEEEFIDKHCENGRIMTEDEYFQAVLVHPEMPDTYEDTVLILKTLKECREKYKLEECSFVIYNSEQVTMKLMRMIRRQLMFRLRIKFL